MLARSMLSQPKCSGIGARQEITFAGLGKCSPLEMRSPPAHEVVGGRLFPDELRDSHLEIFDSESVVYSLLGRRALSLKGELRVGSMVVSD